MSPIRFPMPHFSFRMWIGLAILLMLTVLPASSVVAQENSDDPAQEAVKLFNQGQDAHEKGDLRAAIDLYTKAVEKVPSFPEAELQKGNAQLSLGMNKDAETSFRKAIGLREDWTLALSSLGSLLVTQERYSEARPVIRKAIDLDGQNFPALTAYTQILIRTKAPNEELKALLAQLNNVTTKVNSPADVWAARGALENALGDSKLARLSYQRARQLDPRNTAAIGGLADIALSENEIGAAAALVDQLKVLTRESDDYKLLQARVFASQGNHDQALKLISTIKKSSDDVEKVRRSIETAQTVDPSALTKQLQDDPKNVQVLAKLCNLERVSNPLAALEYCRRASELDPQNIDHAIGFGGALIQAKRFDAAAELMRNLIKVEPDNTNAHAYHATALFELKQYEEAKPEFRWLADRQPDKAMPYYFLAITYDQLQEYTNALASYERFLTLADKVDQKLEIDKVSLRLPTLQKLIKDKKGKRQ